MLSYDIIKNLVDKVGLKRHQLAELTEQLVETLKNDHIQVTTNGEFRLIPMQTIRYVQKTKLGHIISRAFDTELCVCKLDDTVLHRLSELGFKVLDHGTLVNMEMIRFYDSDYRRVYFTDSDFLDVTGAAMNNIVKPMLGTQHDKAKLPRHHKRRSECSPIV